MNSGNLKQRLLFALWAIPLGWWIVNSSFSLVPLVNDAVSPFYPAHLLAAVLIFLALVEYLRMLSIFYPRNGFWLIYIWFSIQIFSYILPEFSLSAQLERYDTYGLLLFVALESFVWGHNTARWKRASMLFSGSIFLNIALFSLWSLYEPTFQSIFPAQFDHPLFARPGMIVVLAAVFLCDSVAYFVGNLWGSHRFSSISPNKTIEGSLGGLCAALIIGFAGWHFFAAPSLPLWLGAIMGLLIGLFAQIGDLLVSLMKRYFRVKDASNIIPGHGGILDRFDSVFFTAPILTIFFIFVRKFFG